MLHLLLILHKLLVASSGSEGFTRRAAGHVRVTIDCVCRRMVLSKRVVAAAAAS